MKESKEQPTQAEMFIETRRSTKGKQLDEDTQDAIVSFSFGFMHLNVIHTCVILILIVIMFIQIRHTFIMKIKSLETLL